MKINTNIPGWNGPEILKIIAQYASGVPDGGHILELGALFGRSTYSLGHNKKDSVGLTTIDIWPTINLENHKIVWFHDKDTGPDELVLVQSKIIPDPTGTTRILPGKDFHGLWKEFTKGIINNKGIRDYTTMSIDNIPMSDFIYHDADHTYERVYEDLVHWLPKLKPDGIIIVDDYEIEQFPGVIQAVDQFANENGFTKEMVTGRNVLLRRR